MRRHHKHASEKRASLDTVIDVVKVGNRRLHVIPASEANPARLASDPDVTIQLSEQETKEAKDISKRTGSTS